MMPGVTQAAFAQLCGVSRQRVGQWIDARQIDGDATSGSGRGLRIDVDAARRQLRERLDDIQRAGIQGLDTSLDDSAASISLDQEIKRARLRLVSAQADRAEAARDSDAADVIPRDEAAAELLRQQDALKAMAVEACGLAADMACQTKYPALDRRLLRQWLGACFREAWARWEATNPVVFGQPTSHWKEVVADIDEKRRLYGDAWGAFDPRGFS
jgi:phage terminase Nu1 subunit (DNA packaging protein)